MISVIGRNEIAIFVRIMLMLQFMSETDTINAAILRELSRDGRISNLTLSEKIGLSPSATLRRVQVLERMGVIQGYRAVVDPAKLGIGFTAYIAVGLNDHTKAGQEAFERAISIAARAGL